MNAYLVWSVVLVVAIIGAILVAVRRIAARHKLEGAYKVYQDALTALRKEPNDAGKHESALVLGSTYATLTRKRKGMMFYTKAALMKDINTATAKV
jgi:hypothetical protein